MLNSEDALTSALACLRRALALLDESNAPAQIAAHVDLAAHQLEEHMADLKQRAQRRLGNC
jgi:hypothetical protein